jgi:hypothetical protein
MATIEGKSSAEWFKAAAQRQKRSNAYASYEAPAAKAEPARQTAAMPKPANHASTAKAESKPDLDTQIRSTQEQITKARAPEAKQAEPAKPARPASGQAKGSESEWTARRDAAKQAGRVRSIVRRSEDEGRSSLHRLQSEARAKVAAEAARKKRFEKDWWDAKNGVNKVATIIGEKVSKPVIKKGVDIAVAGAKAGKAYFDMQAGYLDRARRWLVGDPDARRRLGFAK